MYLSTVNLTMLKEQARKLIPKHIGSMKVLKRDGASKTYTLDLPEGMRERCIHPKFHIGLLCQHDKNDDILFPRRDVQAFYDIRQVIEDKWVVDEIIAHHWTGNKVEFLVRWNLGDSNWELSSNCKELEALDRYLELQGVPSV